MKEGNHTTNLIKECLEYKKKEQDKNLCHSIQEIITQKITPKEKTELCKKVFSSHLLSFAMAKQVAGDVTQAFNGKQLIVLHTSFTEQTVEYLCKEGVTPTTLEQVVRPLFALLPEYIEHSIKRVEQINKGKKTVDTKFHAMFESVHPLLLAYPDEIDDIICNLKNHSNKPYTANAFLADCYDITPILIQKQEPEKNASLKEIKSYLNSPCGHYYIAQKGYKNSKDKMVMEYIIDPVSKLDQLNEKCLNKKINETALAFQAKNLYETFPTLLGKPSELSQQHIPLPQNSKKNNKKRFSNLKLVIKTEDIQKDTNQPINVEKKISSGEKLRSLTSLTQTSSFFSVSKNTKKETSPFTAFEQHIGSFTTPPDDRIKGNWTNKHINSTKDGELIIN